MNLTLEAQLAGGPGLPSLEASTKGFTNLKGRITKEQRISTLVPSN